MALDEDAPLRPVVASRGDDTSRGKGARTNRNDVRWFSEIGELRKKRSQFRQIKRRPVRLDQRAIHSVRLAVSFYRFAHCDCILHIHRF